MKRTSCVISLSLPLIFSLVAGCSTDSPTTPTTSLTAPLIQSPAPGERLSENPPTLRVSNVQGAVGQSLPTYAFQVAADESFSSLLASVEGIGQGAGSTFWHVPEPLEGGTPGEGGLPTYYWRARASASGEVGPWSSTANFSIPTGFFRPGETLMVSDPLVGGSIGEVGGGTFESRGWRTTAASNFIRYHVPTISSGFVQFDVTNLREPNPRSEKRMLMSMWDPSRGDYTTNPFRVHLQKLDHRTTNFGHVRMRFISQGQERNVFHDRTNWNPGHVYQFRMEWGDFPGIDSQWVRVLLDGQEILTASYDSRYQPSPHFIELGGAPRSETLEEAVFSNVMIGRR